MIPYNRYQSTATYKWPYSITLTRMGYYLLLPNTKFIALYIKPKLRPPLLMLGRYVYQLTPSYNNISINDNSNIILYRVYII